MTNRFTALPMPERLAGRAMTEVTRESLAAALQRTGWRPATIANTDTLDDNAWTRYAAQLLAALPSPAPEPPPAEPTYGHCYVQDDFAGCGYAVDEETRCGGLLSHHEAEHFGQVTVEGAFKVFFLQARESGGEP